MVNAEMAQEGHAGRSPAQERRLRKRRQEARVRFRLAADAALLSCHHASTPPCGLAAQPATHVSLAVVVALREEIAELRALVLELQSSVGKDRGESKAQDRDEGKLQEVVAGPTPLDADKALQSPEGGILPTLQDQDIEKLRQQLFVSTSRVAVLQGVLEESVLSDPSQLVIQQIIEEEHDKSVRLFVELDRLGVPQDQLG